VRPIRRGGRRKYGPDQLRRQDCPYLMETLDRRLAGATFEQLTGSHPPPR
jgi:hypothetical protein